MRVSACVVRASMRDLHFSVCLTYLLMDYVYNIPIGFITLKQIRICYFMIFTELLYLLYYFKQS